MENLDEDGLKNNELLFENGIKICSKCKKEKPLDCFYKDNSQKSGYHSSCKDCVREMNNNRKDKIKQWFDEHKQEQMEYQKQYSKKHAQKKIEYNMTYKEYFAQKRKEYEQNNIEKIKEQRRKYSHKVRPRYTKYIIGAKDRNLEFNITIDEFDEITQQPCFYCGELKEDEFGNKFNGIDRIDSSKGYIMGNIVSCCSICNGMKLNYDIYDWIIKINSILSNLKKKGIIDEDVI